MENQDRRSEAAKPVRKEKNETKGDSDDECPRCNGVGLICGFEPDPAHGCVDFLNTTCPECEGTGRRPASDES
jgi:hypothetical protein